MLRCTIQVNEPDQIKEAYLIIKNSKAQTQLEIVRIKNKLSGNGLKVIHLNLIFGERIICEIQIKYGKKTCDYYANKCL